MIRAGRIDIFLRYVQRKILLPVTSNDFVLDVGGGDKPFWRANIILDKYVREKSKSQRFTGMPTVLRKGQVLLEGDAQNMPFKDKSFDFIFSSHLLEHVLEPQKVLEEMMRVGKRGIIEIPRSCFQKIEDMPSHLWFCRFIDGKLYLEAKTAWIYDDQDYAELRKLFNKYEFTIKYEEMITTFFWDGKIKYVIDGKAREKLLSDAEKIEEDTIPDKKRYYFYKYSSLLASLILFWKRYRGNKSLESVLSCPKCHTSKMKILLAKKKVVCKECNHKISVIS